jgi:hypothetical protein
MRRRPAGETPTASDVIDSAHNVQCLRLLEPGAAAHAPAIGSSGTSAVSHAV